MSSNSVQAEQIQRFQLGCMMLRFESAPESIRVRHDRRKSQAHETGRWNSTRTGGRGDATGARSGPPCRGGRKTAEQDVVSYTTHLADHQF